METSIIETSYPLTFREEDAKILGQYLKNRQNVVLLGMRRVGISSFLRYFLYHSGIAQKYIEGEGKHLFIPVDLNNLVEREIFPFWILTLKRIADVVEKSDLSDEVKKTVSTQFLDGIQSKDLFLLIENVRKSIVKIVEAGYNPTLFFLRFDRIKDAATPAFLDNLQGLQDATHHKLSYVITSFRSLDKVAPEAFPRGSLVSFSHDLYIKPAKKEDMKIVYESYKDNYKLDISERVEKQIFDLVDGYNQYLQLTLIYLNEHKEEKDIPNLSERLTKDERVNLQSEELWESLSEKEQTILIKVTKKAPLSDGETEEGKYLFDTGIILASNESLEIFSPLFEYCVQHQEGKSLSDNLVEFSKKEHLLFNFLKKNLDQVCEREQIIESVWPEQDSLGVSDWAIDRLIARLRNKLKQQNSPFEIVTIKTRGYKMVNS